MRQLDQKQQPQSVQNSALFVVLFTGLNNAVAYQKGQLSGMSDDIIARVMEYLILFMEP